MPPGSHRMIRGKRGRRTSETNRWSLDFDSKGSKSPDRDRGARMSVVCRANAYESGRVPLTTDVQPDGRPPERRGAGRSPTAGSVTRLGRGRGRRLAWTGTLFEVPGVAPVTVVAGGRSRFGSDSSWNTTNHCLPTITAFPGSLPANGLPIFTTVRMNNRVPVKKLDTEIR